MKFQTGTLLVCHVPNRSEMSDTRDLIRPENKFACSRGGQEILLVFMRKTEHRSSHKLSTRFDSLAQPQHCATFSR